MSNTLTFRKGVPADREQLKQLGFLAYGQYRDQLTEENWRLMEQNLGSEQNWDGLMDSIPFVCADGDHIVGMAFLYTSGNANEIYPGDWSYIRMVGIHPDYERRGIARRLTAQCIEEAGKLGEQTIALHTSELMNAARRIYESLGFVEIKDLGLRFGIRYWLFRMDL
jgi:ribosomal protein S18 acetylase RimI-like enzyme